MQKRASISDDENIARNHEKDSIFGDEFSFLAEENNHNLVLNKSFSAIKKVHSRRPSRKDIENPLQRGNSENEDKYHPN